MATVKFNPQAGPIFLNVVSGPPCVGGFRIWYRNNLIGDVHQIYSNEPNLIHDQTPDNLVLPFSMDTIQNITLRVVGHYGPLPNHTQIGVRYLFYQNNQLLDVTPKNYNEIQENHTPPPPYKQYNHDFEFKPIP
ncbi:MAG: hypothetical protein A2W99_00175 [Bacteroidetes bacterium GWF2_33_16]|nr:MAG: hypothetical protein A2X00_02880 [Bacteroidetes bacterium GWE2_32_14]OFY08691.1 MAG: hypothetical protein A2W99_00175 [Bacteroidetes bacterium GWF2_33_16]